MLIVWIIKNYRMVLDILLIIAAVIAFSFWDPFGIMDPEPRLHDTPVSIKSVKQIGELVSAEYYGEVVSSLSSAKLEEYTDEVLDDVATTLLEEMLLAIDSLSKHERVKKKVGFLSLTPKRNQKLFYEISPSFTHNIHYRTFLEFTYEKLFKGKKFKEHRAINDFVSLYLKNPGKFKSVVSDEYKIFFKAEKTREVKKTRIKRHEVVFIGRGWVKAGFDLSHFTEKNFHYDAKNKVAYLVNLEAKILDHDINPWFIPERKIKGFELVRASAHANYKDVKIVKTNCKAKLLEQAFDKEILEKATTNACRTFQQFFSVLLDEEVKEVRIYKEKYQYYGDMMMADSLISASELQIIDQLLLHDTARLDTNWKCYYNLNEQKNALQAFLHRLTTSGIQGETYSKVHIPLCKFSNQFNQVYDDGALAKEDTLAISDLGVLLCADRALNKQDTLWYPKGFNKDSLHSVFIEKLVQQDSTIIRPEYFKCRN